MRQADRVLKRLERGPLTPMEAFVEMGITRLAARVNELRKEGHPIRTDRITVPNRFGEQCVVAEYRLMRQRELELEAA